MHKYMRAVGFSEPLGRQEIQAMLNQVTRTPSSRTYISDPDNKELLLAEFQMDMAENAGICVCGEFDGTDEFSYEYYYPYFHSDLISTGEEVVVEPRIETESYCGICDDLKVGVTIIFRLLNYLDFIRHEGKPGKETPSSVRNTTITFTALSTEGTVMFPIQKSEKEKKQQQKASDRRIHLMEEARNGDENAMRSLARRDMDNYTFIWNQVFREDVYSLVDACFMPCGVECDLYSVLGEIEECKTVTNRFTGEELYQMVLNCSGLQIGLCMNKKDLYGEPAVGRRFKGVIWLQGTINYPE